jgi:hypothetical protein
MKINRYLSVSIILIILLGSCHRKKKIFKIPHGHVAMFGYGSLMSKNFIQNGLLQKNYNGPFLSTHLKGYKRSWTFAWPTNLPSLEPDENFYKDYILIEGDTIYPQKIHFLNIKKDPNSIINGVLYIVPKTDLTTYDSWELGYERIEVTDLIQDYLIEGGPVFAYRALPDFVAEPTNDYKEHLIELSYYKIIQDAFHYWGKDFESEYKESTEPFDTLILKDSHKSLWVNPPLEKINELKSIFK